MRKNYKKISGMGFIGWIITIPAVLIGILILIIGFYEGRKAYWDYKVTQMCEEDGGVIVYEYIELSREKHPDLISSSGNVIIPSKSNVTKSDPYYVTFSELVIKEKGPKIRKTETRINRSEDSKILSLRVGYSREGGDFPMIIGAPSNYSCRNIEGINTSIIEWHLNKPNGFH